MTCENIIGMVGIESIPSYPSINTVVASVGTNDTLSTSPNNDYHPDTTEELTFTHLLEHEGNPITYVVNPARLAEMVGGFMLTGKGEYQKRVKTTGKRITKQLSSEGSATVFNGKYRFWEGDFVIKKEYPE